MKKYLAIGVILLLLPFNLLFAQTDNIHLSFTPGDNKEKSVTVTWTSRQACDGIIKYGGDSAKLSNQLAVVPEAIAGQANWYVYKAELKNLKPDKLYYYTCSFDNSKCKSQSSNIYSFTTPPNKGANGKYTIGVWGDTQNNDGNKNFEITKEVVSQLVKYPLDFTVHTGDIVENGSVTASWDGFLHTAQPLNAKVPFMPSTGNHDVINAAQDPDFQKPFPVFYDLFNLPEDELNYSFDYGNIHFVAINSGYAAGAAKVDKVLFKQGSPEYIWLENNLAKAKKDKKIKWVILYEHYPTHSFGVSLVSQWQSQINPIIDKYKVDLVLSGHRHVYERHASIRNGAIEKPSDLQVYAKPKGTVFITNGSAGGSLQGVGGSAMPSMVFTSPEKVYTYAIMTIRKNELAYTVYTSKGVQLDQFKIIK